MERARQGKRCLCKGGFDICFFKFFVNVQARFVCNYLFFYLC
jgi:hypothetical protein